MASSGRRMRFDGTWTTRYTRLSPRRTCPGGGCTIIPSSSFSTLRSGGTGPALLIPRRSFRRRCGWTMCVSTRSRMGEGRLDFKVNGSRVTAGANALQKPYCEAYGSSGLHWGCDVRLHKVLEGADWVSDSRASGGIRLPRRRAGARPGNGARGRQRPYAGGLPRLGVPHGGRALPAGGSPSDRGAGRVRHRAPRGAPDGRDARAAADPALREPLRLLLRRREPGWVAHAPVHPRRRLPAVVPLRQLRDAHEPEAVGPGANRRVSAVTSVRLGACHGPNDPPLAAPQPRGAGHHPAARLVRGFRATRQRGRLGAVSADQDRGGRRSASRPRGEAYRGRDRQGHGSVDATSPG